MCEPAIYDVVIVGAGPVGLFAAFYAGIRGMSAEIVDSLPEPGGQLAALYPEKVIYDMPGFVAIRAQELVDRMVAQGTRFGATLSLNETITSLTRTDDGIYVLGGSRTTHLARTVILSVGPGAFSPKRLDVPGLADLEGRGVYYMVRDTSSMQGRRVVIVGGGDSALDWAKHLEDVASSVVLIHRRDGFRAHEESVDWLLNRSRVRTMLWHELRRVEGAEHLERVVVFDNRTGAETCLEADALLISVGFSASLGPLSTWGLELAGNQIVVNGKMETNLPGVYAVGDVATYPAKLKLIATGVGEACIAVNFAKTRIDPTAKAFPGHSSALKLPADSAPASGSP